MDNILKGAELVALAERIATQAHEHQKRKFTGVPYITHPEAVAKRFKDSDLKAIAWLHDLIEDTAWTEANLINAGVPHYIVDVVVILTKKKGESYLEYIARVARSAWAIEVKKEDIKHNLIDLPPGTMRDKYELALHYLHTLTEYDDMVAKLRKIYDVATDALTIRERIAFVGGQPVSVERVARL